MTYKEFKPSKKIEPIVDTYWSYSNLEKVENETILPDGSMDIIFNLGTSTSSISTNSIGISGMMTEFSNKSFNENSNLFGIRLKSGTLSKLTKFPLFEIKNKTVEASLIIPEFNLEILEKLDELKSTEQKIQIIENEISSILSTKKSSNDRHIFSVIEFIRHSSEPISIKKIAENHFISLRQLERKFKLKVGVTLKEYERIIRFKKTKEIIKTRPNESLLHIAFDNGYFDHSHLTNEFKRFSGQIPSDFR